MFALLLSLAQSDPVAARVDAEMPALETLYRELHAAPELSYAEEKTSARMAKELRDAGFEVTERFGAYDDPARVCYGVVGVLRNGDGPTILVRTDMDALPVEEKTGLPHASRALGKADDGKEVRVMHACGHDLHMASWVGTARVLAALRDRWRGTILMVGQPSEERAPGGARAMVRGGLYSKFRKPDFALALHDNGEVEAGKVGWTEGYFLASADSVDITVRGVGGHGAAPHMSKDPVVLASQIVVALQTIVSREVPPGKPAVVTVGSIHGGTKRNVIPDEVKLQLTVRTYDKGVRELVLRAIERIAVETAKAAGVPDDRAPVVEVLQQESLPATWNDPALVRRATAAMRAALGDANVVEREPVMGSEDFGYFALDDRTVPAFMLWLGAVDPARLKASKDGGPPLPSLHSSVFAPAMPASLRTGVRATVACVLALATSPR
ncbi:MAG TPA: amidohydrolase [Planctomycetota bacterium]|nr:amidohydrolase [Planctomycetota bacterium]